MAARRNSRENPVKPFTYRDRRSGGAELVVIVILGIIIVATIYLNFYASVSTQPTLGAGVTKPPETATAAANGADGAGGANLPAGAVYAIVTCARGAEHIVHSDEGCASEEAVARLAQDLSCVCRETAPCVSGDELECYA